MSKFCVSCGKQLEDNAAFCNGCGAKQGEAASAPAQQAAPVQPQAPAPEAQSSLNGNFAMFSENPSTQIKVDKIINDKVDPFIIKRGLIVAIIFTIFMQTMLFFGSNVRMAHFDDNEALSGASSDNIEQKVKDAARQLVLYTLDGDDLDYEGVSISAIINQNDEKGNAVLYIGTMADLTEQETTKSQMQAKGKGINGFPAAFGIGVYGLILFFSGIMALVALVFIVKGIIKTSGGQKMAAWNYFHSALIVQGVGIISQFIGSVALKLGTDKVAGKIYESMGKDASDAYHLVKLSPMPIILAIAVIALQIISKKARNHFYQVETNARASANNAPQAM